MENILVVLFSTTVLLCYLTTLIEFNIRILSLQGIILFLIVIFNFRHLELINLIFLIFETLIFKAIIIPLLLINAVRKNEATREVKPYIPHFYAILIETIIFSCGFIISYFVSGYSDFIKPLNFGIAISTLISSIFLIINRKRIISHILGYMMMENSIFLLSISLTQEMPLIINLGTLLDIFIGIYLFIVILNKIQDVFDKDHIDVLTSLKD